MLCALFLFFVCFIQCFIYILTFPFAHIPPAIRCLISFRFCLLFCTSFHFRSVLCFQSTHPYNFFPFFSYGVISSFPPRPISPYSLARVTVYLLVLCYCISVAPLVHCANLSSLYCLDKLLCFLSTPSRPRLHIFPFCPRRL